MKNVLLTFPFGFFLFGEIVGNSSESEISPKSLMMKKKDCRNKIMKKIHVTLRTVGTQ